ncbi:hypothetical protein [Citrobacter portucalensis]|uniref:hypothetical protein n=1 Tax=Citrobacter portucalensis TaxID=1639133 RepID=UPI00295E2BC9|nr:hypothetical protein [Citrobacter portucalensis]WOU48700.1 hypothetical protein R4T22_18615 [Citrobacter portucalensis]
MTTNNHPAHGPVSLDRLHQIREILSKAAAQSDGGNLGYAMADAVKVIYGSIAAFGAEPVADVVAWNREGEERTCDIRLRRFDLAPGPLFAVAQPAPVVPDEREAFNVWNNDTDCPLAGLTVKQAAWLAWLKRSGTIKSFEPATDEFEVWARSEGLIHDSYGLRTVNTSADVARKAWNACRAAILQGSQPVSNRDELPLDYLQGHKDGLEWAAQLAEANHPQTGDWLYDDPIELAKAIRNGPDMPEGDSNSPVTPDGWCRTCRPVTMSDMRFVVCPECGNKRCPHANDHRNACTGSNKPGQEGSAYPAAPQQEVK